MREGLCGLTSVASFGLNQNVFAVGQEMTYVCVFWAAVFWGERERERDVPTVFTGSFSWLSLQ